MPSGALHTEDPHLKFHAAPDYLGLGVGGRLRQRIYADPFSLAVWDTATSLTAHVHILNTEQWHAATGRAARWTPVSAATYTEYALP